MATVHVAETDFRDQWLHLSIQYSVFRRVPSNLVLTSEMKHTIKACFQQKGWRGLLRVGCSQREGVLQPQREV